MLEEVCKATIGALLHDIGKIAYRAKVGKGSHSIRGYEALKKIIKEQSVLDCVRCHHGQEMDKDLADNALAYIVYIADNIASGADRRKNEGENEKDGYLKYLPLASIYTKLNNNQEEKYYQSGILGESTKINYPIKSKEDKYDSAFYDGILRQILKPLETIKYDQQSVNNVLSLLEKYMAYIPASTDTAEVPDITLYDHSKITAALAGNIYCYLKEHKDSTMKSMLLNKATEFYEKNAFLMVSCDLSGIQSFIYTVNSDGALKNLRARSLYLEILLEHIVDEILGLSGLSRANLIYTGGGHAYLLLPNTEKCKNDLAVFNQQINRWFIDNFGSDLYLAIAWQMCSGNDLMNDGGNGERYSDIFRELSAKISQKKNARYSAEEIMQLNQLAQEEGSRECSVCRKSTTELEDDRCPFCAAVKEMARLAIDEDCYFVVLNEVSKEEAVLPLPDCAGNKRFLTIWEKSVCQERWENEKHLVRIYSKNHLFDETIPATNLWLGDYHVKEDEKVLTFNDLAQKSQGIKRIGVLRADVDNLGQAFTNGFKRKDLAEPNRYMTLSRTATLSRSLSMFFKYHLNGILSGSSDCVKVPFHLKQQKAARNINIIYSGGDDLFLVGAWDDLLEAAVDIRQAFAEYTQGTLTLSAGIGIFNADFPLIQMAEETGALEDMAKKLDEDTTNAKNALALFGTGEEHIYHWQSFEDKVVREKLDFLLKHLQKDESKHITFVYQLLNLLRGHQEKINLARFAYTLAKRESSTDEFNQQMYQWYLSDQDREQLMTAIYLYVYLMREE